ncbi:hypothetical protein [Novosphingobium kaempferiae]|uniref:hypothetical protein n=1 Tax=Novosphingobium kaempferiae TaxID=2896849 RepID=UPI001E5D1182|nr:hypothetical protein [Novosphingobium kaempferiae]
MSDGKTPRDGTEKLTREERLAAKLRENLRRRKAQARAVATGPDADTDSESLTSKPPLAKSPPES